MFNEFFGNLKFLLTNSWKKYWLQYALVHQFTPFRLINKWYKWCIVINYTSWKFQNINFSPIYQLPPNLFVFVFFITQGCFKNVFDEYLIIVQIFVDFMKLKRIIICLKRCLKYQNLSIKKKFIMCTLLYIKLIEKSQFSSGKNIRRALSNLQSHLACR